MVDTLEPPIRTRRPRPIPGNGAVEAEAPSRREPATPGEVLRAARLRRRISLAEAEQATRIRLQYLQALEDDDPSALPAGVYSRGFIRNYAIYLGVPPDTVLDTARDRRWRDGRDRRASLRPTARPVSFRVPRATWLFASVAVAVALAMGTLAWLGLTAPPEERGASGAQGAPAGAATPTTLVQLPQLPPAATATGAPTSVPAAQPTATPAASGRTVDVELRTTDRSWVRATVDGKMVLEETLSAGQTVRWSGQQSVALRVGNAGGVEVVVNGQRVGTLGAAGAPVDREWTR